METIPAIPLVSQALASSSARGDGPFEKQLRRPVGTTRSAPTQPPVLVAECTDSRHPTLIGRVRVRWISADGGATERWVAALHGLAIREGDRVLLVHAANCEEPIVTGVVDGFARRPRPTRDAAHAVELASDEALCVRGADGRDLVEIFQGDAGPVVRLVGRDVDVEIDGDLRVSAASIALEALEGPATVRASDDVVVEGEVIHLN